VDYDQVVARRGQYAKGVAKREEILTAALEVIARTGYSRASVRELADGAGLSQAGLLHYFSSKEELFAEVLRKRDEVDSATWGATRETDPFGTLLGVVRHNVEVPGLVQLYARLSAEGTEAQHPAHDFFQERYRALRAELAQHVERRKAEGTLGPEVNPEYLASILLAVADGLQTQWMLDPEIDMGDEIEHLLGLLGIT
jgi:AcrR family transcriptional regulator